MSNKLITTSNDPQTLKVVYGNDFTLHVFFTRFNVETKSWEYYDMSSARNLNFYLVSTQFKRIKLQHTMQSDGSLIVNVISTYLQNTTYGVECQWDTNGKNRRTYTPILIQIVNTTPEADVDFSEYEANNAYDLNIRIVSDIDVIRIGGVSNIPEGDIVTLSYLESNYYDKDAIDDNYYDKNETDHLLTYYVNDSDLETLLNAFEAEIEGEFIDHTELDEALGYFTTTDDLTTYYATKAYVNAAIAAIPATDLSNYVDLTSYQHISGEKSFEDKIWIVNRENAQWHVDNIGGEIAYAGKFSRMTGNQLFIGEVIAPHQNAAYNTSNVNNTKDEIVFEKVTSTSDYKAPTFSQMAKITSDGIYEGNTALRDKYTTYSYIDSKEFMTRNELNTLGYMTQSDISAMSYSTTNYVDTKVLAVESQIPDVTSLVSQSSLESQLSNYVTTTQLNSSSYATTSQLESATSDMATKTYVQSKVNDIVIPDVSDCVTYDYLNNQSYATTNDIPDVSEFVSYDFLSNQSYLQPAALNGYATETYVANAVNSIDLSDFPTYTYINSQDFATKSYVSSAINDIDLSSYVTTDELDAMGYITADDIPELPDVSGFVTNQQLSQMSYVTSTELSNCGYITSSDIPTIDTTAYVTHTELSNAGYITSSDIPTIDTTAYVTHTELSNAGYITSSDIPDTSGLVSYSALNEMAYITINDVPTIDTTAYVTHTELSNAGYITSSDLPDTSSYVTYAYLTAQTYTTESYVFQNYTSYAYIDELRRRLDNPNAISFDANSPVNVTYIWAGTNAQLRNISVKDPNTLYITTDDEAQQVDLRPYALKTDVPSIVVCTQSEYNAYVSAGTISYTTIYMIKEQ